MTPEAEMRACEEALLHTDFSSGSHLLDNLLAPDFEEISAHGRVSSRDAVIAWLLQKDPAARWQLEELSVVELAPGLRQVRYKARQVAPQRSTSKGALHSSLWRSSPGEACWRLQFHQATKIL